MERLKYILNIVIVTMLLLAVAIGRDGRAFGIDINEIGKEHESEEVAVLRQTLSGKQVINTTSIAKDVIGYGGRTPVEVTIKSGVIERVELLPHSETPVFMEDVVRAGLLEKWNGLSLAEAATQSVDAVSGATFTAVALIENVRRAAAWGIENIEGVEGVSGESVKQNNWLDVKEIAALLVILMGIYLSLAKPADKRLVLLQHALNVVVLGFWCGSFLSLSQFVAWAANGINLSLTLVAGALLLTTLALPLFGRKGSYCQLHCPAGAAQELASLAPFKKLKINPKIAKFLNSLRYYILIALMFMMWIGVGFDLMGYEIFTAFMLSSASNVVIGMAVSFLALSLFVHRPYCRFVCPTGALITMSQITKSNE